jgi:cytochrome c-type biogenesis protein CcmF
VTGTITQEFYRGARVRSRATGIDLFTSLVGLFARSRRRYGGYVIHLGIVLIFVGFAGNAFSRTEEVPLKQGQQVELKPYVVKLEKLTVTEDAQKQMVTAEMSVTRNGKAIESMYPARWFFHGHEQEPTTEVALRRGPGDDLYLVLASYDVQTQDAAFQIHVNPLVNWIWLGVGIMLIGTIIALLPERAFAFAVSHVPEGAVTGSIVLLCMLAGAGASVQAQHMELSSQTVAVVPRTPLERDLQGAIICMCGTCGRKRLDSHCCQMSEQMSQEVSRLLAEGKTRDQVIQYFVAKYGSQEVLAQPIDRGFNRLAWLLPYGAGLAGVIVAGAIAMRWARRGHDAVDAETPVTASPELQQQLDDELRDLD